MQSLTWFIVQVVGVVSSCVLTESAVYPVQPSVTAESTVPTDPMSMPIAVSSIFKIWGREKKRRRERERLEQYLCFCYTCTCIWKMWSKFELKFCFMALTLNNDLIRYELFWLFSCIHFHLGLSILAVTYNNGFINTIFDQISVIWSECILAEFVYKFPVSTFQFLDFKLVNEFIPSIHLNV